MTRVINENYKNVVRTDSGERGNILVEQGYTAFYAQLASRGWYVGDAGYVNTEERADVLIKVLKEVRKEIRKGNATLPMGSTQVGNERF